MNKLKNLIFIFVLLILSPLALYLKQQEGIDNNVFTATREYPTANGNGYLHFYEVGTEYVDEDSSLELEELDRNEDITLQYDYFIDKAMYEKFISDNSKERLDNINFYLTDSKDGLIYEKDSWSMPINQEELVFDVETTGVVTLKSLDFKPIISSQRNDYVLKPIWGNEGITQTNGFLFANTDYLWDGMEPINLHFKPDTEFYEPDIWFSSGVTTSHNYFWEPTSILFQYYLPYNAYATDVWIEITDLEDKSFVRKYSVTEFQEDYDVSLINWEDSSSYFWFSPSLFEDYNDYIGRSKFQLSCGLDWERKDELGNVTNTGSTNTYSTYNPESTTKYLTLYFEDIYIDTWFDVSYIEENKTINLNYQYTANRSEVDFFANYIDLVIERVKPEDNSVEETLTIDLVSRGTDEETFQLNNNGSGSISIDTSKNKDFFLVDRTYNTKIVIKDLRYDAWAFAGFEAYSPYASFSIIEEGTKPEIQNQEMSITYNEVKYGDDITLEYELSNFTSPFLIEYRFVFESKDFSKQYTETIIVNAQLVSDNGTLNILFDEYKEYIDNDWEGKIYIEYVIADNPHDSIQAQFRSNKVSIWFQENPSDENRTILLIFSITLLILSIALIVLIIGIISYKRK